MKKRIVVFTVLFTVLCTSYVRSQQITEKTMNLQEVFSLLLTQNQSLKVNDAAILASKQGIEIAKLQRLPSAQATMQAGYLGNASLISSDFSEINTSSLPHFAHSFSVQATELLYKGNLINHSIASSELQTEISILQKTKNEQDLKLLASGYFLDLYKLYNQKKVYEANIELAEKRLKVTQSFYKEGITTKNTIIRNELMLRNLQVGLLQTNNAIQIVNSQLKTLLNIQENIHLIPEGESLQKDMITDFTRLVEEAKQNNPTIQLADKQIALAETLVDISKTDKLPAIGLYAGNNLNRPITNSNPAVDAYLYGWQTGISVSYNISSLWKANTKIQQYKYQLTQAQESKELYIQSLSLSVQNAVIRYNETIALLEVQKKNKELADENLRITTTKFDNQLALLIEVIDAANAKLEADLQLANIEATKWYAYYVLQNTLGTL